MLTVIYMMTYLDRVLIILLLQPIKEDLHLSDTGLGFLTGVAFGLFYATLGLPIARWADRGNRVSIASIAMAIWAAAVMGCLFVANFAQLIVARVTAAIGEAGCMPPTYSLIGDYFPKSTERTRAMTVYMLAGPAASLISFVAGGALNERYGWQKTFFMMGVPGLLVALVAMITVREPRADSPECRDSEQQLPALSAIVVQLWHRRSFRHLSVAMILLLTMASGLAPWYAAFMMRSHGMGTAELGMWLGVIFGLGGIGGILLGGYLVGRFFANNERGQVRLSAIVVASLVPCFVAFLLLPERLHALIALIPLIVVFNFFLGPTYALLQRLVSDEVRATTLALVMLVANLIGMGLAPQLVGIVSDLLEPFLGADSLRYAMLMMSGLALWSAYHFWQVGRTVKEDLSHLGPRTQHERVETYSNRAVPSPSPFTE